MHVSCLIIGFNWLCLERVSSPSIFDVIMCEQLLEIFLVRWRKGDICGPVYAGWKGSEEGCQLFQRNTRPPQQLHHPPTQAWSGSELQYFSSSVSLFLKKKKTGLRSQIQEWQKRAPVWWPVRMFSDVHHRQEPVSSPPFSFILRRRSCTTTYVKDFPLFCVNLFMWSSGVIPLRMVYILWYLAQCHPSQTLFLSVSTVIVKWFQIARKLRFMSYVILLGTKVLSKTWLFPDHWI